MKELVSVSKDKPLIIASGFFLASIVCVFLTLGQHENLTIFAAGISMGLVGYIFGLLKQNSRPLNDRTSLENDRIRNQHQQLVDAIEVIDDGFLLFDKNHKLIVSNKKIRELYQGMKVVFKPGVDRKDVAFAAYDWFEAGPDKEQVKSFLKAIERDEVKPRENVHWSLPNGRQIIVNEQYTHDCGIVSIIQDVSEQKKIQRDLEDKSRFLKAVLENVSIGISVYDSDHKILSWNEKYLEIMEIGPDVLYPGIDMRELLKANFETYADVGDNPDDYASLVLENFELSLHTKVERRTKSGKFIEIFRTNLPGGGYVCTFTDVTLTKSAQMMLQESESRYRKMVELSPDAILVQKDGLVIYANAAAIKLLGIRDLHGLIGAHVRKFFPTADRELLQEHFGSSDDKAAGDNVPSQTTQVIKKDGTRIDVEIEATVLLYGDRPVMQLIARDISAQTKIQELLQQAKDEAEYASQLKGTFLANMSHELRTPLNAVIGFSEIIKNQIFGAVGSDKYVEYAEDIHSSGKHLLALINDILDYSKMEASTQTLTEETVDMEKLVTECLRLVEHQRESAKIVMSISFSNNLPDVIVDAKILKQVILNLLSNALKFTPTGGEVLVQSEISAEGSYSVSVIDNGIGIKEEDISKALTPFVQIDSVFNHNNQGTGLGLPLSKNLMELHGGNLTLTSVFGEGTNATITLPKSRVLRSAA